MSNIKDIDFKYLDQKAKDLKMELGLYRRVLGSHKGTGKYPYRPRNNVQNNKIVAELNESINDVIKALTEGYGKKSLKRLEIFIDRMNVTIPEDKSSANYKQHMKVLNKAKATKGMILDYINKNNIKDGNTMKHYKIKMGDKHYLVKPKDNFAFVNTGCSKTNNIYEPKTHSTVADKDFTVERVLEKVINPGLPSYYVLKGRFGNEPKSVYLVTSENPQDRNRFTGAGTIELSEQAARKTAHNFARIEYLQKKYGKQEGYKRWMRGETDKAIKDANEKYVLTNGKEYLVKGSSINNNIKTSPVLTYAEKYGKITADNLVKDLNKRLKSLGHKDNWYVKSVRDESTVQSSKQLAKEINEFLDNVFVNKTRSWADIQKANIKGTIINGSFSWGINGGKILLNFIGTDTFVSKQYSIPYTNKNNKYYVDMRVLNDAIRDIYKLMEQKAHNKNMLNTYKPVFSYFTIEFMEGGPSEQAYMSVTKYKNKKITSIQDINKILKSADELYINQHGRHRGYLKLYIDLVFTVGTQKYLYHGLRFDIGDGNNYISNSDIQQVSKLIYSELTNPKQFSSVRSIDNVTVCNKDKLIQSGSKEALQKNIKTEIESGKDPKQAAAIAYSVQRKNDKEVRNIKAPYVGLDKRIKDAVPFNVKEVAYKEGDYSILRNKENPAMLLVVKGYKGENPYMGGGTIEFTFAGAQRLIKSFLTMDKLNKKYGQKEGYKRWMEGKTDKAITDYKLPVTVYVINKGQPSQYFGLKNAEEGTVLQSVPKFKTIESAKKYALTHGYDYKG